MGRPEIKATAVEPPRDWTGPSSCGRQLSSLVYLTGTGSRTRICPFCMSEIVGGHFLWWVPSSVLMREGGAWSSLNLMGQALLTPLEPLPFGRNGWGMGLGEARWGMRRSGGRVGGRIVVGIYKKMKTKNHYKKIEKNPKNILIFRHRIYFKFLTRCMQHL